MNVCPACNTINPDNVTFCVRCGTRCIQVYAMPIQTAKATSASDGFSVASFVIGMVSFPLSCINIFFFFLLPFTCLAGITGLIFGLISIRRKFSGMATAGIVLNIAAILCSIAFIIIFAVLIYALYTSAPIQTLPDIAAKV